MPSAVMRGGAFCGGRVSPSSRCSGR